jgi:hypothetical protein
MKQVDNTRWENKERVNCDQVITLDKAKNQYISIPHKEEYNFEHTDSFSIRMLVERKINNVSVGMYKWDGNSRGYGFNIQTDGAITIFLGTGATYALTPKKFPLSRLMDVVITYNGSTKVSQVYVNSILELTHTYPSQTESIKNTTPITVGKYLLNGVDTTNNLDGNIGSLSIFNKALSADEVAQMHYMGNYLPTSTHANCVGHWVPDTTGKKYIDVVEQYNYAKVTADGFNTTPIVNSLPVADGEEMVFTMGAFSTRNQMMHFGISNVDREPFDYTYVSAYWYFLNTDSVRLDTSASSGSTTSTIGAYPATYKMKRMGSSVECYVNDVLVNTIALTPDVPLYWFGRVTMAEEKSPVVTFQNSNRFDRIWYINNHAYIINGNQIQKTLKRPANHGDLINYHDAEVIPDVDPHKLLLNDAFSDSTGWTLGTGWSVELGEIKYLGLANTSPVSSAKNSGLVTGRYYRVTYTITSITRDTGSAAYGFYINAGGNGTADNHNVGKIRYDIGTYTDVVRSNGNASIYVVGRACDVTVDNLIVEEIVNVSTYNDFYRKYPNVVPGYHINENTSDWLIPYQVITDDVDFTVECFFRPTTLPDSGAGTGTFPFGRGRDGFGAGWSIVISITSDCKVVGSIVTTINGSSPIQYNTDKYQLSLGRTYHLALTWSWSEKVLRLLVNGFVVGTYKSTDTRNRLRSSTYGWSTEIAPSSKPEFLSTGAGVVSHLKIWDKCRSEKDIRENMYRVYPSGTANLKAQILFNELNNYEARDTSGNGYIATITEPSGVAPQWKWALPPDANIGNKYLRFTKESSQYMTIPSSAFSATASRGFAMVQFYLPEVPPTANITNIDGDPGTAGLQPHYPFIMINTNTSDNNRIYLDYWSGAKEFRLAIKKAGAVYVWNLTNAQVVKGINTIVLQSTGTAYEVYINGNRRLITGTHAGTWFNNLDAVNNPLRMLIGTLIVLDVNYGYSDYWLLQAAVGDEPLSRKEIIELHNNTLGKGFIYPSTLKSLAAHYICNKIDSSVTPYQVLDLSGNNRHASLTGFTATEVDPAHIDYKILETKTLRGL